MTAGRLALALYAAFLLGIAVWRPWTEPAAPFSGRWELVPFTGTADLWRAGIVPFAFLFVGNVACFVPFGFCLPALTPLRRAVVPLGFLVEAAESIVSKPHAESAEGAEFDSHEARTSRFVRKWQISTDIFVIITKNHLYFRGRL